MAALHKLRPPFLSSPCHVVIYGGREKKRSVEIAEARTDLKIGKQRRVRYHLIDFSLSVIVLI